MFVKQLLLASLVLATSLDCTGGVKAPAYPRDTTTIDPGQQLENAPRWYDDAVIYQVWVSAFADGVYNDGIGDLPGLQGKLDYLQSLGVNTIWLSPVFECAYKGANMHGYDTTDYTSVNDRFGTRADLKALIDAVHGRGMRILFDFVPNHTSTSHPWFTGDNRKSFYVWQPTLPAGWGFPWGGGSSDSVWAPLDGAWYYTAFGSGMADLNYYDATVRATMQGIEAYWLDRGFDGMRVDAVRYFCESGPGKAADTPDTHARLQAFRSVLDGYLAPGNAHPRPGGDAARYSAKMMIAEAWTDTAAGVAPYYGNGSNEFNLCLDFSAPWAVSNAITQGDATQLTSLWEFERDHYPAGYRSATFDSNHDNLISRPGTQYKGDRPRIILAEALNLLAPGTPIIYYGNEVGMTGASGTDLDLRRPMDWGAVAAQTAQTDSILNWTKYLIKARTTYPALRGGYATLATDQGTKALACLRSAGTERVAVVANLTATPLTVTLTDLGTRGVAAGTSVGAILGDVKSNNSFNGTAYPVSAIPPYGVRVLHLGGSAFQGTIHGDIQ
jgi:alpha-glucosidase